MSRSSDRGQTEPYAALVAVVAVGLGLSLYVGVLDAELPGPSESHRAEAAIERVESAIAPSGVARPARIDDGQQAGPVGHRTNVTLAAAGRRWQTGPAAPANADSATARIGVGVAPARVRTGTLRVRVWS